MPPRFDAAQIVHELQAQCQVHEDSDQKLRVNLGEWQGFHWNQDVILRGTGTQDCFLELTGGEPNLSDLNRSDRLAEKTGMSVATLFHVPNQPLWDMMEDDLIAHTFAEFLRTEDPTFPLLFPMTAGALAVVEFLSQRFERVFVSGASKRGWTSWLVASFAKGNVAGCIPRVYDNLNVPAQMQRQMQYWGACSPSIADYTNRDLVQQLDTELGRDLGLMIDPYTHKGGICCPVFSVVGTTDPYWTVDASELYWNELTCPHSMIAFPGMGHWVGDMCLDLPGVSGFLRAIQSGEELLNVAHKNDGMQHEFSVSQPDVEIGLWIGESDSLNFSESRWSPIALETGSILRHDFEPSNLNRAIVCLSTKTRNDRPQVASTIPFIIRAS